MKFSYFVCELTEFILKLLARENSVSSRSTLDKSYENYTFDRCLHRGSSQKSLLACGDAKKEN